MTGYHHGWPSPILPVVSSEPAKCGGCGNIRVVVDVFDHDPDLPGAFDLCGHCLLRDGGLDPERVALQLEVV